ncbi:hypothetical protein DFJ69_6177 [Thermomonospora umbrina]|uniref:Uncharacterized protein n=1 Tax=Thermomonospora umbrina TaxID=111806 RepID=A0A3D9T1B4_9ACTN|nr:hypothetical protein DFJ69_6177 [Thermomonospora umbrina]
MALWPCGVILVVRCGLWVVTVEPWLDGHREALVRIYGVVGVGSQATLVVGALMMMSLMH